MEGELENLPADQATGPIAEAKAIRKDIMALQSEDSKLCFRFHGEDLVVKQLKKQTDAHKEEMEALEVSYHELEEKLQSSMVT